MTRFKLLGGDNQLIAGTPANSVQMQAGGVGVIGVSSGLATDSWNHLALTWKDTGADMDVSYYLNGTLLATVTRAGDFSATSSIRIGTFNYLDNGNNIANQFIGRMYDLQFYDGALSSTQVDSLASSPGTVIPEASNFALLAGLTGDFLLLRRRR